MESSAADVRRVAPPPGRWVVDRRLMGVAIVTEIVAVFLAYMAVNVPVLGPKLTRAEADQHWTAAFVAALVVVAGATFVVRSALRARRAQIAAGGSQSARAAPEPLPRIPRSLQFERTSPDRVRLAAAISLATIPFTVGFGAHLWLIWLAILTPWAPIVALEAKHKYARDAIFACFGLMVILQLLHMVEHTTQVGQLLVTGGSLAASHGVIGQLDFETVHFVADTTLWIGLGTLAIRFKARNVWLWVAFAAASLHQIEHFFLFWLHVADKTVYVSGGVAGIMGNHGLIGSPLDRPYLHYTYNFIVIVPMLIAFWDEARYMDRIRWLRPRAG